MIRTALATATAMVATLAFAAPVQAADWSYGARGPYTVNQPLNAYSWAGPYLGGNLGYNWGSVSNNPTRPSGFMGGVQIGYNVQSGPLVIGLEGDVITTQDVFLYDILGEDQNGRIIGRHRSTGIGRPKFWERARYFNEENRLAAALDAAETSEEARGAA